MATDVPVPQIGESINSVFISAWLKQPGEFVAMGESLLEVDSDKASMEVPAPVAGVVLEHLAAEGDEVAIGGLLARIDESATAPEAQAEPAPAAEPSAEVRAGPAARQAANKQGVDLSGVQGSGKHGRVMSDDVRKAAAPAPAASTVAAPAVPADLGAREERVKMSPLRRTIARRLVEAQQTAAMLTTFNEVDMTAIMELRKAYQDRFVKRYGIKLGFMSFFVKASIEALKQYPAVNSELDGDTLVYKNYWNVGVAVSTKRGLVVPVLRDVDQLSFAETELAIAEVAGKARDGKLLPSDFAGGTFTISNGGIFGSMMSTPILNSPQVGILGMHNILQRPVGIDGEIVLRPMMYLAMSYDHRVIDGREAVSFLVRIKELCEAPERMLIEV